MSLRLRHRSWSPVATFEKREVQLAFQGALPGTVAGISTGGAGVPGADVKPSGRSRVGVITIATRLPLSNLARDGPMPSQRFCQYFFTEIVQDLLLYRGVASNLSLADESWTVRAAHPHQHRTARRMRLAFQVLARIIHKFRQ